MNVIITQEEFDDIFRYILLPENRVTWHKDFKNRFLEHVLENLYRSDGVKIKSDSIFKRLKDLETNEEISQMNAKYDTNFELKNLHDFEVNYLYIFLIIQLIKYHFNYFRKRKFKIQ
jgi:hypothetical protein